FTHALVVPMGAHSAPVLALRRIVRLVARRRVSNPLVRFGHRIRCLDFGIESAIKRVATLARIGAVRRFRSLRVNTPENPASDSARPGMGVCLRLLRLIVLLPFRSPCAHGRRTKRILYRSPFGRSLLWSDRYSSRSRFAVLASARDTCLGFRLSSRC